MSASQAYAPKTDKKQSAAPTGILGPPGSALPPGPGAGESEAAGLPDASSLDDLGALQVQTLPLQGKAQHFEFPPSCGPQGRG